MSLDDSWKDGSYSPEAARDHADYLARLFKVYVEEFIKNGFARQEAIQIAIAVVPHGFYQTEEEEGQQGDEE